MTGRVISTVAELETFLAEKNGKPPQARPAPAHAKHAPSSADQRRQCPASRRMQEYYPQDEESPASRDGTAAHWAVAELLHGNAIDVGLVAPNGVMLDAEMCEAAEMCAEVVLRDAAGQYPIQVEQRVEMPSIHRDVWGTPDYWVWRPRHLVLTDFKYGHRFVSEYENWQLIEYAEGILPLVGVDGSNDADVYVTMRIVQPRCYVGGSPIREWTVKAVDLRGYANEARMFEERAALPDAPMAVGPACRDCTARHACPAAQRAAYAAMDVAETGEPFDLPPEALGVELRYIDRAIQRLEARRTGLEAQALNLVKRGQPVPHWRIEQGYGRKRWKKPDAEVAALGDMMGVDIAPRKPVTPTQAIKAGLDAAVVDAYSETPLGEAKLKPDDGTQARRVFGIDGRVNKV